MTTDLDHNIDANVTLTARGLHILKLTWATTLFGSQGGPGGAYETLEAATAAVDRMVAEIFATTGLVAPSTDDSPASPLRH